MDITFNNVYNNHYDEIVSIIYTNIENKDEISIAINDVLLKINDTLSKYDPRKCNNIMNFLSVVIKHTILDFNRKGHRKKKINYVPLDNNYDNQIVEQYNFGIEDIDFKLKENLTTQQYEMYQALANEKTTKEFAKKFSMTEVEETNYRNQKSNSGITRLLNKGWK